MGTAKGPEWNRERTRKDANEGGSERELSGAGFAFVGVNSRSIGFLGVDRAGYGAVAGRNWRARKARVSSGTLGSVKPPCPAPLTV